MTKIEKVYVRDHREKIFETIGNDADKINAVRKFNYSSSKQGHYSLDVTGYQEMFNNERKYAFQYYEYMKFKGSKFKSDSSKLIYDEATGRITQMVFNLNI